MALAPTLSPLVEGLFQLPKCPCAGPAVSRASGHPSSSFCPLCHFQPATCICGFSSLHMHSPLSRVAMVCCPNQMLGFQMPPLADLHPMALLPGLQPNVTPTLVVMLALSWDMLTLASFAVFSEHGQHLHVAPKLN